MAVNWDDPCERAAALTAAYYGLLSGKATQEIEFQSGESRRRLRYQAQSVAQMNELKREMDAAKAACDAKTEGVALKRRRFAIGSTTKGRC
jgi:hypothetical protein